MKYTYKHSSDMWECGDGCCTMWDDVFVLYGPGGEELGTFAYEHEMTEFLLTHAGIELESV